MEYVGVDTTLVYKEQLWHLPNKYHFNGISVELVTTGEKAKKPEALS